MSLCCGMWDAGGTGLRMLCGGPEEACRRWNLGRSRQWVCGTAVEGEPDWRGVAGAARAEGMGMTPRGEEDCTGRIGSRRWWEAQLPGKITEEVGSQSQALRGGGVLFGGRCV